MFKTHMPRKPVKNMAKAMGILAKMSTKRRTMLRLPSVNPLRRTDALWTSSGAKSKTIATARAASNPAHLPSWIIAEVPLTRSARQASVSKTAPRAHSPMKMDRGMESWKLASEVRSSAFAPRRQDINPKRVVESRLVNTSRAIRRGTGSRVTTMSMKICSFSVCRKAIERYTIHTSMNSSISMMPGMLFPQVALRTTSVKMGMGITPTIIVAILSVTRFNRPNRLFPSPKVRCMVLSFADE